MRVLLISHTSQSRTEGQPKAEQLAQFPDVELRVLAPDRWQHYGKWRSPQVPTNPLYGYEVGRVLWPWVGPAQFYLHWYPGLARLLKEFRPEIIDLWDEPWGLVSAHACWLRNRLLPTAKIVAETEQNIPKKLPPPFEWFRTYTLKNANFAVARNVEAVDVLRNSGYAGPAETVPNAVDTTLFRPLDRSQCRQDLGLSGYVAGYVGRLVEEKGLMDMVDALKHTPSDVQLLFVGTGPMGAALEARAAAIGRQQQVRVLPGRPLEDLPRLMNALDVLVLPSRTTARWKEQFGRVIIEAHACGTPVIGSNSGAIPEVVGKGGLIFPEGDGSALAAALCLLRDRPFSAREMGEIGLQQVKTHYTWERVAHRMRVIYKTLNG
ncbi:MAG: glycosyltransferase [Armatimonadota bacterium]|nr:glycosyltransferase [Armatimonadota bacterium]